MTALIDSRMRVGDDTEAEIPPALALQPLAYGYMRVPSGIPDAKVRRMELKMRRFAEHKGFCLAATFYEFQCGVFEAFYELVEELQRAEAHYVIVPTFRHLARNRLLQNSLLTRLDFDAHAEVFELMETTT
jgi:hypothetical protein